MSHVDDFVIDRFEGDVAVCIDENRNTYDIPRSQLPLGACEGNRILRFPGGPWRLDDETTRRSREMLKERMNQLWNDN